MATAGWGPRQLSSWDLLEWPLSLGLDLGMPTAMLKSSMLALPLVLLAQWLVGSHAELASKPPRTLQRSDAKKWEHWHDTVAAEIKVASRKFIEDRGQVGCARQWSPCGILDQGP